MIFYPTRRWSVFEEERGEGRERNQGEEGTGREGKGREGRGRGRRRGNRRGGNPVRQGRHRTRNAESWMTKCWLK